MLRNKRYQIQINRKKTLWATKNERCNTNQKRNQKLADNIEDLFCHPHHKTYLFTETEQL